MPYASIPLLVEQRLVALIGAESFASGVSVVDSFGDKLMTFPAIQIKFAGAAEEPTLSSNFRCNVDIIILGRSDPDNDSTYRAIATTHDELCGDVYNWLTDDDDSLASSISGAYSGFSNTLVCENIRLDGFAREIDTGEGVFEDTYSIELYCYAS